MGAKGRDKSAPPPRPCLPSLALVLVLLVLSAWVPPPGKTASTLAAHPWLYVQDGRALDASEQVIDETVPPLARMQPPLHRLGFACDEETCSPTSVPQTAQTGIFRAGAIDLTGDGIAESVRLLDGQVVVYGQGAEAWRGLPEWRVADLALGDPNDDGRGELLLALWKPDEEGVQRSHPFVAGYREGAYRVLWGGSAVPDPIHEIALGDVDGDGAQELVALEERDGARAVSVWRWHGWGFSLVWRSPTGRYRDLALVPGGAGCPSHISVGVEP